MNYILVLICLFKEKGYQCSHFEKQTIRNNYYKSIYHSVKVLIIDFFKV